VSRLVLTFDGDGDEERVVCDRVRSVAGAVEIGDFIACPYSGFVHVHDIKRRGRVVYLVDCDEREHLYNENTVLELARPNGEDEGGPPSWLD
jgi:hypothetical protein